MAYNKNKKSIDQLYDSYYQPPPMDTNSNVKIVQSLDLRNLNKDNESAISKKIDDATKEIHNKKESFSFQERENNFDTDCDGSYVDYTSQLIVTDEMKKNHNNWANGHLPFSGTAITADDMDEAFEQSFPFVGLNRPQAVYNSGNAQIQGEYSDSKLGSDFDTIRWKKS